MRHKGNPKGSNTRLEGFFLNKLLTKDKLQARRVQLQHNRCDLCNAYQETVDSLFFSCRVSRMVWNLCDRWVRVSIACHIKARANFQ